MESGFFAMLFRMKYINRWGLMRNTRIESLSEHSLDTAVIAHALGILRNKRFGGSVDAGRLAALAMYHDAGEIITGDLPTPVKYHDEQIRRAYKQVEAEASWRLLSLLPQDLREEYQAVLLPQPGDEELWRLIKAADKLSALIKCIEEERAGNQEFTQAKLAQIKALDEMRLPEADAFRAEFLGAFYKTLDEQEA